MFYNRCWLRHEKEPRFCYPVEVQESVDIGIKFNEIKHTADMEELKDRSAYVKATMADGVCVLEGTTTWCPQCKAIAPFVDQMIKKYPDAR